MSIMIDLQSFYNYENREVLVQDSGQMDDASSQV